MSPEPPRYPFAPLESLVRASLRPELNAIGQDRSALKQTAEVLGVTYRHLMRLRKEGLSEEQADRYAVRAGLLPVEVWGDAWLLPVVDPKERKANYQRAYRKRPGAAERNRAHRRAYYRENREYELARQRRADAERRKVA